VRGGRTTTAAGTARLNTLLGEKKAGVYLMCHHRIGVAPLIDDLNQAIILFVKTVDDEGVELRVRERLSNGRQRVSKGLDLVVVLRGGGVKFLALAKLTTEGTGTGL
jgi:hypothetical protein